MRVPRTLVDTRFLQVSLVTCTGTDTAPVPSVHVRDHTPNYPLVTETRQLVTKAALKQQIQEMDFVPEMGPILLQLTP